MTGDAGEGLKPKMRLGTIRLESDATRENAGTHLLKMPGVIGDAPDLTCVLNASGKAGLSPKSSGEAGEAVRELRTLLSFEG